MSSLIKAKIAVISDLHCRRIISDETLKTRLHCSLLKKPINRHPVESLKKVIEEESISVDYLFCLGDITDKADKDGFISGISFIDSIRQSLNVKADNLIYAIGNHDVDPYKNINDDFTYILKNHEDKYPLKGENLINEFWSDYFCITEYDDLIILLLNTCYNISSPENLKLSPIFNEVTIDKIDRKLKEYSDKNKIKITLCHHHPIQQSDFDDCYSKRDMISNGDKLLNVLKSRNFNLVIHGHKHFPRLKYDDKLPIFCSGSFSSLENVAYYNSDNTFHVVEIFFDGKSCKGNIETWVYNFNAGWKKSKDPDSQFPSFTGFGFNGCVKEYADKIINDFKEWYESDINEALLYQDIIQKYPDISFFTPNEQIEFTEYLINHYKVEISPSLQVSANYFLKQQV